MVTDPVHRVVGLQKDLVADVADVRQPAHVLHDGVQFVSVHDEDLPPVPRAVDGARHDLDVAEIAGELRDELVMVARDVDHPCPFARFAQDFLYDIAVRLGPVAPPAQRPDVDQVADQIQRFELMVAEELEQSSGLAAAGAQMHVRNPAGSMRSHLAQPIT